MAAGVTSTGQVVDLISVFQAVGQHQAGQIDDAGLLELEQHGCPPAVLVPACSRLIP